MRKTLDLNELGYRLKKLREDRNYTQKDFAEACGFSQAQVSGWELGKNLPNLESIQIISSSLGLSVADFLAEEPIQMAPPRKPDKFEMAIWVIQAIGIDGFKLEQVRRALVPPRT